MKSEKMKSVFKRIKQYRYIIILSIFLIWMFFLDTHSFIIHNKLNQEIDQLKAQKKELEKNISKDKNTLENLKNIDSLEVFGRRNYNLKKENETIYFIEYEDTID